METEPDDIERSWDPSLLERAWRRFVYVFWRQVLLTEHPGWDRFFSRRCPHLAGMIAYFGVLSIIPAAFLLVSTLASTGALESQGWLVEQIQFAIPGEGANAILRTVESLRDNSGSLGLIGIIGLIWGTSNFFSCIESGLNIIYGVRNRHFIFQKAWVLFLMLAALVAMVAGTVLVAVALPLLRELNERAEQTLHLPLQDGLVTLVISLTFAFIFFLSCYRFLPNIATSTREVWRGALIAALAFEASIQVLPAWVAADRGGVVINAFAGALIVLIWYYVVAFILLVGGTYNWWYRERLRRAQVSAPTAAQA